MKRLVSMFLTVLMAITAITCTLGTASAATTTVNGKAAAKGGTVQISYQIKAPEKMEDIQVKITYTSGLQLVSAAYNSKMKKGMFIHNEKLTREIRFNSICIDTPMDFTTKQIFVTLKFKVTSTGTQKTSLNLQCLDSVTNKSYGKEQKNTLYSKLSLGTITKIFATGLKLNRTGVTLKKGKTFQLKATVSPAGASKSVKWTTNKKAVATVTSKGKITAKKKGVCYITCTTNDGSKKSKKCKVTVK